MHGGSSDPAAASTSTNTGVASGSVDRSVTSTPTMSTTQGTPVSQGYTTPPVTPPVTPPATTPSAVKKSISAWVSCSGTADDSSGVALAFAAAKNAAFTLVVDCPVKIHSGIDIAKTIFIDNGMTVEFTGTGKFFVDNLFHPAFVVADSTNVMLSNWNIEWDGSIPVNPNIGGYELNGKFVPVIGHIQPAGAFNDVILADWLTVNRGIVFNQSQGWVKPIWDGGVNASAVFFITGDTSNMVVSGLKLYVPANVGGDHFLPMAFSLSSNWTSSQTVTGTSPHAMPAVAVPHGLTFADIDFDGTYMGWQGSVQDAMFENIRSHRYGDLQDANGENVGGMGKWFPPPHLFYLNYITTGDPSLFNTNVHISNVVDSGPRIGTARDRGGKDTTSGYALSLKLSCNVCSVDQYNTNRPDGFMDVLPSNDLTVTNVTATWNSAFVNNIFPGWRFPSEGYTHVTFENIQMTDVAPVSTKAPIGNAQALTNANIVFTNVLIGMAKWGGSELPAPNILGANNNVVINFTMATDLSKGTTLQKGPVLLTLQANPSVVAVGRSTVLKWTSKDATRCSATGGWNGALGAIGSKSVKLDTAGEHDFTVTCENAHGSSTINVPVIVQ